MKIIMTSIISLFLLMTVTAFFPGEEDYLAVAEVLPEPVGGIPGLYKNIIYPELAIKNSYQGKVFVLAFINEDGNVDNVKVLRGVNDILDQAAVDGIKRTKFSPGKHENKQVKVKLALTIQFKL